MSYSLTEIELEQALRLPGCPLCRIGQATAERYIRDLLWESVNDGETRRHFLSGLGYCKEHTRMLACQEIEQHGDVLGVNILYENLVSMMAAFLESWEPEQKVSRRKPSASSRRGASLLTPVSACRVCQIAAETTSYSLGILLHGLGAAPERWLPRYQASGGLCRDHFRQSLWEADSHPEATRLLRADVLARLKRWREGLQGYSRKKSWEYRNEPMSGNEKNSWREALAFFSCQPPETLPPDDSHDE